MGWAGVLRRSLLCGAAVRGSVRGSVRSSVRSMADDWHSAKAIYDFHARDIDGNDVSLDKYRDSVCIIANVASKCGKTAVNYTQLVDLHAKYAEKGLRILGFPCSQFGNQEPGDDAAIKAFAEGYGVKFDMFSKIDVNGDGAHPLWKWMKEQPKGAGTLGNAIKWNFTKFLINREGQVVKRYSPMDDPQTIEKELLAHL